MTDDTMIDAAAEAGEAIHSIGASVDGAVTLTTQQAAKLAVSIERAAAMIRGLRRILDFAMNEDAFDGQRSEALLFSMMQTADQLNSVARSSASRFDVGAPILGQDDMDAFRRELRDLAHLGSVIDDVAAITMEGDADGRGPLMTVVQTQARMVGWIADSSLLLLGGSSRMRDTADQWLMSEIVDMDGEQEQVAAARH
jgi:hypothetical protein